MKKQYGAVLTGDVVGSSALSPDEHRRVVELIKSADQLFPEQVVGRVDVFSGDSWQMVFSDFTAALRTALYLRATLKREKEFSVDSRVSMAWGELDISLINRERVSESIGEVFTVSGRRINELKRPLLMCFAAPQHPVFSATVDATFGLIDTLVRPWSPEQARVVVETLLGRTQAKIAKNFKTGQSSINKSLQAAHWTEIEFSMIGLKEGEIITLQGDNRQ